MAEKITTGKTGGCTSVLESAKRAMQTLKVDKVFVSPDGYIFPKESDARAYVGKGGNYSTVTKADLIKPDEKAKSPEAGGKGTVVKSEKKTEPEDKKQIAKEPNPEIKAEAKGTGDALIDEHKKQD